MLIARKTLGRHSLVDHPDIFDRGCLTDVLELRLGKMHGNVERIHPRKWNAVFSCGVTIVGTLL